MSVGGLSPAALRYYESKHIEAIFDDTMHNLLQEMPANPLEFLEENFRRPTPVRVIIGGPPCSGKSTLAAALAARFHVDVVSPPPDAGASSVVAAKLASRQQAGKGWVLDGFPETRAEVIQLQSCGAAPQRVFYLQASPAIAASRAANENRGSAAEIAQRHQRYAVRWPEVATAYHFCLVEVLAEKSVAEVLERVACEITDMNLS